MKHNLSITIILLVAFLLAQLLGIAILYNYIDPNKSLESGVIEFKELPVGERPPIDKQTSYLPMMIILIVGTLFMLAIIKYNLQWLWKSWFLISVFITLFVAFNALIPLKIALFLALLLALWKIFKPNFWVQNITELFIYGGLAAIFVPIFNVWSISLLLILVSLYDAYAVWKSKHMVKMAQSQTKAKVFAGLLIPYPKIKNNSTKTINSKIKSQIAILGGGDIGFPLLFAGTVLKEIGLWQSIIIPFFSLLGLAVLLFFAKEKKFYPAMPFISAGCFLGLIFILII